MTENRDPFDRNREVLIRALNDLPTQPNCAWSVLNAWDDLVAVARAAREYLDSPTVKSNHLRAALARLEEPR